MHAIVLARRDFREYDSLVSLYTREFGKRDLLVRGVKKIASKNAPHLEPFSHIVVDIAHGREIDHLTTAQPVSQFRGIWQSGDKLFAARFAMSVVERMVKPGQRDDGLFFLLLEWLRYADKTNIWQPIATDSFLALFLSHLGLTPRLDACVVCGKAYRQVALEDVEGKKSGFYFAGGGLVCAACRVAKQAIGEEIYDCGLKEISNLSLLLKGKFALLQEYPFAEEELRRLHRLVYAFLIYHMEHHLADWWEMWYQ